MSKPRLTPPASALPLPVNPATTRLPTLPLYALAVVLGAAVLAHAVWLPWPLLILLCALIASKALWQWRFARALPWWIRVPGFLLAVAAAIASTGSPLSRDGGVALLLALAALKYQETQTLRDGRMLIAALLFISMTTFLFDQNLMVSVYTIGVAVSTFSALTLLRRHDDGSGLTNLRSTLLQAARGSGRLALAALPLAIIVFLFFPRLGQPLWGAPWNSTQGKTGIGDEMRPGMISKLWPDDTPAFRVSFDGPIPVPRDLYWRGPVLLNFDGQAWRRSQFERLGDGYPLTFDADSVHSYEVLMEATDQHWLFPLDHPITAPPGARVLSDGQMLTHRNIVTPRRVRLRSSTHSQLEATPLRGSLSAARRLPPNSNPQALALARRWRAEGRDDAAVMAAALALFHASFGYSLEPPPLTPERSVDEFLFETQSGYCEHFASAFAFLMRAAGIPARVVTGYLGGIYNGSGNYWTVRNSDAHAWTEVWLPDRGWVRVDPTSAVAPERISRGSNESALPQASRWYSAGWAAVWRDRFDVVSRWWRQQVVDFDALRQRQLLTPFGIKNAEINQLLIALGIGSLAAVLFGVWWSLRSKQRPANDPLLAAWHRFDQRLRKRGLGRQSNEDPLLFTQRAARALPRDAARILELGKTFTRYRYANVGNREQIKALVRGLRQFRPQ